MKVMRGLYRRGRIWWIGIAGPDGKPYCESTRTTDIRRAEILLIQRKKELQEGKLNVVQQDKEYTYSDLVGEYVVWAKRLKTFKDRVNRIKQLERVFGPYPLKKFTTRLVEQWQTERLSYSKPATVNHLLAYLKASFTKAVDWGMVSNEVLLHLRKVKSVPENNRRLRYLSQEECKELIDACAPHLRPIVIVAVHTGMRRGEVFNLRWSQVDLRHGFILLDTTKGGGRLEIPIESTVREVLESIPRGPESEYVFPNKRGNPYRWLDTSFKVACQKADIHNFRFHDLRHTFASHLVMAGIDIITVKELLGHKTLAMTLRYAHLAPGHKREAMKVLEERLTSYENKTGSVFYNRSTI